MVQSFFGNHIAPAYGALPFLSGKRPLVLVLSGFPRVSAITGTFLPSPPRFACRDACIPHVGKKRKRPPAKGGLRICFRPVGRGPVCINRIPDPFSSRRAASYFFFLLRSTFAMWQMRSQILLE